MLLLNIDVIVIGDNRFVTLAVVIVTLTGSVTLTDIIIVIVIEPLPTLLHDSVFMRFSLPL